MKWMLVMMLAVGCARATGGGAGSGSGSGGAGTGADAAVGTGGNGGAVDLAVAASTGDMTQAGSTDMAQAAAADLAQAAPADLAHGADMVGSPSDVVVHVLIDNFCNSSTNPAVINATHGVALHLTFENDSHDYDADVWSSSGYGFLDMAQGMTWKDPIPHCTGPNPYTEYFDVGIQGGPVGGACPDYRLLIHCN